MTRLASPAAPEHLKICCADLWSHPGVRLLCGETLRPGGRELTLHALDLLELEAGARLLDIGSGPGATLGLLAQRGLRPVGADYSASLATESAAVASSVLADAERLPLRTASMDGAFMECVLSAVPGKADALAETARVLRARAPLALSDVVVEGVLPAPLDSFAGWIACTAGALSGSAYVELLEAAGFIVELAEDHRPSIAEFLAQVARRLALIRGAIRAGLVDVASVGLGEDLLEVGQGLLVTAREAVGDGLLGYGLFIARVPFRS